jgi:hypothetical protein
MTHDADDAGFRKSCGLCEIKFKEWSVLGFINTEAVVEMELDQGHWEIVQIQQFVDGLEIIKIQIPLCSMSGNFQSASPPVDFDA